MYVAVPSRSKSSCSLDPKGRTGGESSKMRQKALRGVRARTIAWTTTLRRSDVTVLAPSLTLGQDKVPPRLGLGASPGQQGTQGFIHVPFH